MPERRPREDGKVGGYRPEQEVIRDEGSDFVAETFHLRRRQLSSATTARYSSSIAPTKCFSSSKSSPSMA